MTYNLIDPVTIQNPFPMYTQMQREAAAVQVSPLGFYAVSRYDDVLHVLKNPQVYSSTAFAQLAQFMSGQVQDDLTGLFGYSMIAVDPPDHTRLRRLVNKAFTARAIEALEPRIRTIAGDCIDRILELGEFDMMAELASPLPIIVIAEMLGIESERREDFRRWSNDTISLSGTNFLTPGDELPRVVESRRQMYEYLTEKIEERRASPGDDLISAMVLAQEEGERLTAEEVVGMTVLLLIAGNETTTNLIGNAFAVIQQHPDLWQQIQADPSIIPAFLEEVLRYNGPVLGLFRLVQEDTELSGVEINKGAFVMPLFAAANRDGIVFENPDQFDMYRPANRKHIAFGFGIHFCLGAPLARVEARIAFEQLVSRLPAVQFLNKDVEWINSFILRGTRALPMKVVV